MSNNIIQAKKLENVLDGFDVYKLITNRFNYKNDYIVVLKIVYDKRLIYLTDDCRTLSELEKNGIEMNEETIKRIDDLLAGYSAYADDLLEIVGAVFYKEEEFYDQLSVFLNAIEAVYQEFLGEGQENAR